MSDQIILRPPRDREAGIERCAVCDGYMRRFESRRRTCADESCAGHATEGCLTEAIRAQEDAAKAAGRTM